MKKVLRKSGKRGCLRHFLEEEGPSATVFAAMGIQAKEEEAHLASLPSPLFHKQRLDLLMAYALESTDAEHLSRHIEATEALKEPYKSPPKRFL